MSVTTPEPTIEEMYMARMQQLKRAGEEIAELRQGLAKMKNIIAELERLPQKS